MSICRGREHKARKTGGRRISIRMKRAYEKGRPSANTKLAAAKRVRAVRTRGGNQKYRALRLDSGNYSIGSLNMARNARIIDVCYNASNNELVRTKTLVAGAVVLVDAGPFKAVLNATKTPVSQSLKDQLITGRFMARISSRPGQCGRADGYVLEGEELAFYKKKTEKKK